MDKKLDNLLKECDLTKLTSFNQSIKEFTTYKIGGIAKYFIKVKNETDVMNALKFIKLSSLKYFILGGGSNILFSDKNFNGVVIDTSMLNKYKIEDEILTASCGCKISELAKITADSGLAGLHNFYYMPGFLGGGLYMNAKANDLEFADIFLEAEYIDIENLKIENLKMQNAKEKFSYKMSPFQKNKYFILNMKLKLKKADKNILKKEIEEYKNSRIQKKQFEYPCCGCVFKNDQNVGIPSGKIIEDLGLRNHRIGGAWVADYHGNFIVNENNAKSLDIKNLIEYVKEKVYEAKKIKLEEEIEYIGDFDD